MRYLRLLVDGVFDAPRYDAAPETTIDAFRGGDDAPRTSQSMFWWSGPGPSVRWLLPINAGAGKVRHQPVFRIPVRAPPRQGVCRWRIRVAPQRAG